MVFPSLWHHYMCCVHKLLKPQVLRSLCSSEWFYKTAINNAIEEKMLRSPWVLENYRQLVIIYHRLIDVGVVTCRNTFNFVMNLYVQGSLLSLSWRDFPCSPYHLVRSQVETRTAPFFAAHLSKQWSLLNDDSKQQVVQNTTGLCIKIFAQTLCHPRKAKRLRSGQWTSLKRRLEVEHVRLAAAQLTDKSTSKDGFSMMG